MACLLSKDRCLALRTDKRKCNLCIVGLAQNYKLSLMADSDFYVYIYNYSPDEVFANEKTESK